MPEIVIVGEAWGAEESRQRAPFVGPSGWCLTKMLEEAGINRRDCYLTNVFNLQPPGSNDIDNLCAGRAEGIPGRGPVKTGKYIRAEYAPEVERLYNELRELSPNVIIALGSTACWALFGQGGISKIRGSVAGTEFGKCIPTYHPAAVLRDWSLRPVTVLDLAKARRESTFPEIVRPRRLIYIEPTLADMEAFYAAYLATASIISFDIETQGDQITCIGFAPSTDRALVVPFVDQRKGGNYWSTQAEEMAAWAFVRKVLATPIPKLAQNGMYDIHYLWRRYGLVVERYEHDTMLLHHAYQPESQKGLGFLGSVYTNESSWKLLNRPGAAERKSK